jgi:pimeloyl-ACP methyl ester carboxylesterase
MRMPHVAVDDDVEIFYTEHGSGPTALLLHGIGCDGDDWSWLATDLATDHRVIIVDQRGHGRSTPTAGPYDAKTLADDAAKVLRHLSIESAVVIGHSLGGLVASTLAVEWPNLVTALVLVDPAYGYTDEALVSMGAAILPQPIEGMVGVFSQLYVDTSPPWQRFWHERRLRGMSTTVLTEVFCGCYRGEKGIGQRSIGEGYLGRRQCPILGVYSGKITEIAAWDRSLPHGPYDQTIIWNDTGHFLHQELPEQFSRLARTWLDGLPT